MNGPECARSTSSACAWCTLARKLRQLYKKSGKSLRQLEQKTYISDSTIHRYLSRKTLPPWPMLDRLVSALSGRPDEFRLLWERAQFDQCELRRHAPEDDPHAADRPDADDDGSWFSTLNAVAAYCPEEVIGRLAETIVSLTLLIDSARSEESVAGFRWARARCWLEIADRIDPHTPKGRMCAMACRQVGELDSAAVAPLYPHGHRRLTVAAPARSSNRRW